MDSIAERLTRYLAHRMPQARDLEITSFARIHGGASRETYRAAVRWLENDLERGRGMILRRDPIGSLIETDRRTEYAAYSTFQGSSVPVPEVLFLEEDERWLERPFFVMAEMPGRAANPFEAGVYGVHAQALGTQFWSILGTIAAKLPGETPIAEILPAPAADECWHRELDRWEKVIDEDELEPQPIVRTAIRWLRRNPPPPATRVGIVHGDYRSGNFLFDDAGRIRAILDWEMCHLGDPLEDLGWALDPLWAGNDPTHPAQLVERQEALTLWQEASGIEPEPLALRWWEVFAHVKGLAIWISGSREYATGNNQDPVLLVSGWLCTARHDQILAERLEQLLEG